MRQNAVLKNASEIVLVRQVIKKRKLKDAVDYLSRLDASRHDVPLYKQQGAVIGKDGET